MRKYKILLFFLIVFVLLGCVDKEVAIYPIKGPVKEKFGNVKFTGIAHNVIGLVEPPMSGNFEAVLENGTKCEGNWVVSDITTVSEKIQYYLSGVAGERLATVWGGTYKETVEKKGVLVYGICSDGRKIEGAATAFISGSSVGGYGVIYDDLGNVYKVMF